MEQQVDAIGYLLTGLVVGALVGFVLAELL
jgi:hypothetical protein